MIDFVLGLTLAGLALRGWFRGFAREAMDLVGVVVGLLLAFRLGAPLGDELVDRFGIAPEAGRIIAAVVIFLLVGAASAVGAHFLSKALTLPGLSLGNRILGVGVAVATGSVPPSPVGLTGPGRFAPRPGGRSHRRVPGGGGGRCTRVGPKPLVPRPSR